MVELALQTLQGVTARDVGPRGKGPARCVSPRRALEAEGGSRLGRSLSRCSLRATPVESAIRTIRSKFDVTPAASAIVSGRRGAVTASRVWLSSAAVPRTIASANDARTRPCGTALSV